MAERSIAGFLRDSGLVAAPSEARLIPLTGGVASDVWKVETPEHTVVVKRALPQLRVAQTWKVPVSRSASEVEWMLEAGTVIPDAVPRILARSTETGMFAMTYFDPIRYPVWKHELRRGRVDPGFAGQVGRTMAAVHAATAGSTDVAARFANDATFHAIRIEPYLEATARIHQDLAEALLRLAQETLSSKRALVHGDISPKNILVGPSGPVFLDAECAWFGEPAFDLAFCLNHLLLKCIWIPTAREALLASFDLLAASYLASVNWEPSADIELRTACLLPALLLARVDGKSPVEYLVADDDKDRVRRVARELVALPPVRLADMKQAWAREISG